jgi:hypothetical protein
MGRREFKHRSRGEEGSDHNRAKHRRHGHPEPHIAAVDLQGGRDNDRERGCRIMLTDD